MDAIVPLAAAAVLGGKAGALARLIAAGLPVPDGVVATEAAGEDEVRAAAAGLAPLAVRSSMSIEDRAGGTAAGVFASRVDVGADDAWAAVTAVRDSAGAPLAAAYAQLHGGEVHVAVILQRFVPGRRVTIYTRAPGRPGDDEAWIEAAGEPPRRLARGDADPLLALALRAERAIDGTDGADVELVVDGDRAWVVQARPIVHPPPPRAQVAPPPALFAFSKGRTWIWDVAHNPDPLSPAQTQLAEAVSPDLRVVAGYLYVADAEHAPPTMDPHTALASIRALVAGDAPDVATAVAHYVAAIRLYLSDVTPQIHRGEHAANTLLAAARGDLSLDDVLARIGHHAPAWDVAVPSYAERPALVRIAIARLRAALPDLPTATPSLAEEDDDAFALAQAHVRHALLAAGRARGLADPDDACWLLFDDLADPHVDADRLRARAAAARTAAERARGWRMPLVVHDCAPLDEPSSSDDLVGNGTGGRATGRIHRIDDLGRAALVPPGSIALLPTVTPALALLLAGARALIAAHGGILDHGAAIARELGIPCVVGCPAAWRLLRDGDVVDVDGDGGRIRYSSSSSS